MAKPVRKAGYQPDRKNEIHQDENGGIRQHSLAESPLRLEGLSTLGTPDPCVAFKQNHKTGVLICRAATNPNTQISRIARLNISQRATRNAAFPKRKPNAGPGRRSTRTMAGKKEGGSGRGKATGHPASHKGGEKGGAASASRPAASRSASAKKAAATRRRNAEHHAHG